MSDYECTEERFLKDVEKHKMEIINNDGVNRHLIFSIPGDSTYRFGLVTWAGYLCIYGDMGTSVFERTNDMFCFFRRDELSINPGYWHEKLQSISRYEGDKKFSKKRFDESLKEDFDGIVESEELDKEAADNLWGEIQDEIAFIDDDNDRELVQAIRGFKSEDGYEFYDFGEGGFDEFTFHFIWQLYAIVWGISVFDKHTTKFSYEVGSGETIPE